MNFSTSSTAGKLRYKYFQKLPNFGDAINPYLLKEIFPHAELLIESDFKTCESVHLLAIGSILQWANSRSICWGTGAISKEIFFHTAPMRVLATRGPLTDRLLQLQGIDTPKIFGDPALLLPWLYKPKTVDPKYKLGVIPHYVDKDHPVINHLKGEGALIIDVFSGIEPFVDAVCSCENIISSSLHGLICADSFNVKNAWIKLSNNIIGNDFKFYDYYASLGIERSFYSARDLSSLDTISKFCRLDKSKLDLTVLLATLLDNADLFIL
jgi:pyruvyltransferase